MFPSSEQLAICLSLKGLKAVSKTGPLWPLNKGTVSGALPTSLIGMIAKAPPPEASQLTAMYFPLV
ncbi:MAG: hypothetical protein M5E90_03300 [Asgard group archaeon]|nr:hypothetical protein [Asgard group archaeon]